MVALRKRRMHIYIYIYCMHCAHLLHFLRAYVDGAFILVRDCYVELSSSSLEPLVHFAGFAWTWQSGPLVQDHQGRGEEVRSIWSVGRRQGMLPDLPILE